MNETLHIFRKDVRHLWPVIALWFAVLTVSGCFDATEPQRTQTSAAALIFAFPLWIAPLFLIASLIHEEELTGSRQYWITRPFSTYSLLLGKVLFMLTFLSLLVVIMHLAVLGFNGVSPAVCLSDLVAAQFGMLELTALGVAVAAVSRNLAQFAGGMILTTFGMSLWSMWLVHHGSAIVDRRDQRLLFYCMFLASILGAAVVCRIQYGSRLTFLARGILAGFVILSSFLPVLVPSGALFSATTRFSTAVDPSQVHLALATPLQGGVPLRQLTPEMAHFYLPVDLSELPSGTFLRPEYVAITVTAPNGETWKSGWDNLNGFTRGELVFHHQVLAANGKYWLYLELDRAFCERHRQDRVQLRADATFTMLGNAQSRELKISGPAQLLSGGTFCRGERQDSRLRVVCESPFHHQEGTLVQLRDLTTGEVQETMSPSESGSPLGSIWNLDSFHLEYRNPPVELSVETREPGARIERVLDVPEIRLMDYGR